MKKQILFNKFVGLPILILSLALSGCKKDDSEDDDGSGAGGGGGNPTTEGGAISFDGTTEYLTIGKTWYTGDFTICLWMEPATITGNTLLSMSGNDKYFFLSFNTTEITFSFESSDDSDTILTASQSFTPGSLYHVCVTGDHSTTANPTGSRIYVNGSALAATSNTDVDGVAAGLASVLTIGYEPEPSFQSGSNNKSNPFHGIMDNLIIWNMALPANAISQIYSNGGGFAPGLAFNNYTITHVNALQTHLLMGEDPLDVISGSSAIIIDAQGNNDATPVGFESNDLVESLP